MFTASKQPQQPRWLSIILCRHVFGKISRKFRGISRVLVNFAGFRGFIWNSRLRDRAKYQKPWSYNEKTILWINYLYLEAVNKLSWSVKVPLKVTLRSQTFRLPQNTQGKTIWLLNVPFTFVLYWQRNAFVFSKQFWVAAAPFKHSSPSMLPVFTKYIPAFYGDMSL